MLTEHSQKQVRLEKVDPLSLERQIRQRLADKVSGSYLGIWLLLPEHLRLGTWDLLRGWAQDTTALALAPRLALHGVHEAALCRPTLRADRSLRHHGFELANGLSFLPSDGSFHDLLEAHTVAQAQELQVALGKLRRASGHFPGELLVLDPHRPESYSQRDMIRRRPAADQPPVKQAQMFFLFDAQSHQPVCVTNFSSARSLTAATTELLELAQQILPPTPGTLLLADVEHFAVELLDFVRLHTLWDLLVPLRQTRAWLRYYRQLPPGRFTPHWAGFAIAQEPFAPRRTRVAEPYTHYIQRSGERPQDYHFKGFGCTRPRPEVPTLTQAFPQRWHIEEFFRTDQALGWKRAGTMNLHIRAGQMSLALVAQAVIHQLRQRLGKPFQQWDAPHLAADFFGGLEGDLRVHKDTILVTYYNALQAEQWKQHFEGLPEKLASEGVDPRIPWLYNYKLDFRFK